MKKIGIAYFVIQSIQLCASPLTPTEFDTLNQIVQDYGYMCQSLAQYANPPIKQSPENVYQIASNIIKIFDLTQTNIPSGERMLIELYDHMLHTCTTYSIKYSLAPTVTKCSRKTQLKRIKKAFDVIRSHYKKICPKQVIEQDWQCTHLTLRQRIAINFLSHLPAGLLPFFM